MSRSLDRVGPFAGDAAGIVLAAAALISSWHPVGGAPRPVLGVADGPFLEAAEPAARELFERAATLGRDVGFPTLPAPAHQPRPQSFTWW